MALSKFGAQLFSEVDRIIDAHEDDADAEFQRLVDVVEARNYLHLRNEGIIE